MNLVIRNGYVPDAECQQFLEEDIVVSDGKIQMLVPRGTHVDDAQTVDAAGRFVLPGLIDIHTHGAVGVHFPKDRDFMPALEYFAHSGVTTVLPTMGMAGEEATLSFIETALKHQCKRHGARVGGIHIEGPFLSEAKRGAMRGQTVPCTLSNFEVFRQAARGQLRVMTIAPDRENATEVIACGNRNGVRMSMGHTNADYEQTVAAIKAGASGATHVFNAMRSLHHRDPGVLGAVLTHPGVTCEVICDMVHLAPPIVQLVIAAKGTDKCIMISDCGSVAGMGDGDHLFGGKMRYVRNGVARLEDGTICCSTCNLAQDAKRLVEMGYSLLDIAKMGARNPAQAAGLTDRGQIRPGMLADLIFTDNEMNISAVMLRGRMI